ncbi:MAG: M23 family metallopeptidase [Deltaproteobacteria bacterium]|nr:M23 family metallopeptidase [Deltaproteobacteria bacterium]
MPTSATTQRCLILAAAALGSSAGCTGELPYEDSGQPIAFRDEGTAQLDLDLEFDGCVGSRASIVVQGSATGDLTWSFEGEPDVACLSPGARAAVFVASAPGNYVITADVETEDGLQSIQLELSADVCDARPPVCAGTIAGVVDGIGGACECLDDDGDGVLNDVDRCPASPPATADNLFGCGLGRFIAAPEEVLRRSTDPLDALTEALDGSELDDEQIGPPLAAAQEITARVHAAVHHFERAAMCEGAAEFHAAVETFPVLAESLGTLSPESLPPLGGDVGPNELWAIRKARLQTMLDTAQLAYQGADEVLGALCESMEVGVEIEGVVASIDNASRVATLEDGTSLIVWGEIGLLYEGAQATGKGDKWGDSIVPSEALVPNDYLDLANTGEEDACTWLAIAPVQAFWPHTSAPPTLHAPEAYLVPSLGPTLQLETGARLAAIAKSCPTSDTHTIDISAKYGPYERSLGLGVAPGDAPVELDTSYAGYGIEAIKMAVQRVDCPSNEPCTVETISNKTYSVTLLSRGSQCEPLFDGTAFAVDELPPTQYRNGRLMGFEDSGDFFSTLTDTNPYVQAQGYETSFYLAGGQPVHASSYPVLKPVYLHDDFAVFPEPLSTGTLMSWNTYGVPESSPIAWPRVIGHRDGNPFWYSCDMPKIRRDLVTACASGPDSDYKLPWAHASGGFTVGQGNQSAPGNSHCNGCAQQYALDISLPVGTQIRAARPGVVTAILEKEWRGFDCSTLPQGSPLCAWNDVSMIPAPGTSPPSGGWTCAPMSNHIIITHEDGTHSVYFHLDYNGAWVYLGQQVSRGQVIGSSGNVGCSTGPHLHFQQDTTNVADSGVSEQIRYYHQVYDDDDGVYETRSCSIPGQGDLIRSAP